MSATGIVFLALSVVMLGLGFYGASVDVVSATGLAESIGQMKNFYFLLGGLILFIVLYRLALGKASLRVQHTMSTTIRYVILIGVGVFMVYPLLWMISATFKDNNEIFSTLSLIPTRPTMEGYKAAMNNYGGDINIWQAMLNTYKYVIPKVIFTVVSSTITAYGFGRFRFRGRNFLFAVLMATLFLPQVVLNIPQFLMYRQFGWVDSPYYLALIVPTLFAQETYFVYMLIQFMRNIPRELDRARADALAGDGLCGSVPVHVVEQRLHGAAALRQQPGALSGDAVCAHEHGCGHRLCVEPRHGRFPDFHYPVAGCVLPRAEAVHGRRDGRRRQGLISLLLFFGRASADRGSLFAFFGLMESADKRYNKNCAKDGHAKETKQRARKGTAHAWIYRAFYRVNFKPRPRSSAGSYR